MDTVVPRHSPLQEQMLRHPHLAEAVDAVHGHPVLQPGRQADAPVPKGSVKVEPLVGGGGVYGVLRAGVGQRIGAACNRREQRTAERRAFRSVPKRGMPSAATSTRRCKEGASCTVG